VQILGLEWNSDDCVILINIRSESPVITSDENSANRAFQQFFKNILTSLFELISRNHKTS